MFGYPGSDSLVCEIDFGKRLERDSWHIPVAYGFNRSEDGERIIRIAPICIGCQGDSNLDPPNFPVDSNIGSSGDNRVGKDESILIILAEDIDAACRRFGNQDRRSGRENRSTGILSKCKAGGKRHAGGL